MITLNDTFDNQQESKYNINLGLALFSLSGSGLLLVTLMASSYEPGFQDLASLLNPLWNFRFVHMRGRAGLVPKISVSWLEILPYKHSRLPGWMAGWILAVWMASSCIACCIFHIISIPFNCSDTALRVTDAKIGPKVKIFVFRHVCFVSRIWRQNSSPGSSTFSHLEPARSTGLIWRGPKISFIAHMLALSNYY